MNENHIALFKDLTILYVEDDDFLREKLESIFKKLFKNVLTACDGKEGFDLFLQNYQNENRVDVIVSDINMPTLNGLEMLRKIREYDKDIPTIFLTAHSESHFLLEAIELHVSEYITKPLNIQILFEKIHKAYLPFYQKEILKKQNRELEQLNNQILNDQKRMKESYDLFNKHTITSETDINGVITYVSKPFLDVSGYKESELIGQNHNIVRDEFMSNDTFENMWKTIRSKNIWRGELKNKKKNDGYYWVESIVFPLFDNKEQIIGYKSISIDITDTKKVDEILRALIDTNEIELEF